MRVLVGISGGVDSAVAAHILKSKGYHVQGAMMKIYSGEPKNTLARSCYGSDKKKEILDARANCRVIGCDFRVIDVSHQFNELVFKKFKNEYLNARTPNPCVLCNPLIKFGVFPRMARESGVLFDKFATGHYVRNEYDAGSGRYLLKRAVNTKKDQSYFLYALTQEKLKDILFPLGSMQKEDVRRYALENGIPVAQKQDSQDFYAGKYSDLFDDNGKAGDIVDLHGNILGKHKGLQNYTIGQRKGLLIAYSEPLYVVGFDTVLNRLIVSTKDNTYSKGLIAGDVNWICAQPAGHSFAAQVKIRSAQQPVNCVVYPQGGNEIKVFFETPQSAVAPGQAAVLYDGDTVLGGGTIEASI